MKKHIFAFVAVLTLFSASSARAQTRSVRANVPFQFNIGQQAFPAGSYQFQSCLGKPGQNSEHGMLTIRDLNGRPLYRAVMSGLVQPSGDPLAKTKLVFSVRDGQRYLSQVWLAGDAVGHELRNLPAGTTKVAEVVPDQTIVAE